MPSVKLSGYKAEETKSGFEAYDGPELRRNGMYRGLVKQLKWKQFKTGNQGFWIVVELAAVPGDDRAEFDGMPFFTQVVQGDKEGSIRSMNNFLAALGVKGESPDIVFEAGDLEKGVEIKTINKRSIASYLKDCFVKLDIGDNDGDYDGKRVRNIYPSADKTAGPAKSNKDVVAPVEDEEDVFEDEEGEDDEEFNARSEELAGTSVPTLKKIAKAAGLAVGGSKDALIERILDAEFPQDEDGDTDEDEEDEDSEDDVEVEADDEEEDDEEADEDEEEDEDDGRAERVEEIAPFNRVQLKAAIKEHQPAYKFLKSQSDDDLREALIAIEFDDDETPF